MIQTAHHLQVINFLANHTQLQEYFSVEADITTQKENKLELQKKQLQGFQATGWLVSNENNGMCFNM